MLNLRDTGSISSIKQNLEDFYVFFFFLFFFCKWILSFSKSNPCIENFFLCCSVLEFSSFLTLAFFLFCQRGLCSTVTGLRYCGRMRETDIKLSYYYYYCTFGKKKIQLQRKTLGLKLTSKKNNLIKTDLGRVLHNAYIWVMAENVWFTWEKKKICLLIFISYIKIIYQEIIVCAFLSKMFKAQVSVLRWHFI